jgi:hypothetical protein
VAGEAQAVAAPPIEQPPPVESSGEGSPPSGSSEKPSKPSKASSKPAKGSKASKDGKGKKASKRAGADGAGDGPSVAAHPRAAMQVARAKGWGGLIGFALGGYLSLPTNTLVDAGLRALVAGTVCYLAAWASAVFAWRHLVVLEIKRREQELLSGVHDPHASGGQSSRAAGGRPPGSSAGEATRAGTTR